MQRARRQAAGCPRHFADHRSPHRLVASIDRQGVSWEMRFPDSDDYSWDGQYSVRLGNAKMISCNRVVECPLSGVADKTMQTPSQLHSALVWTMLTFHLCQEARQPLGPIDPRGRAGRTLHSSHHQGNPRGTSYPQPLDDDMPGQTLQGYCCREVIPC